MNKIKCLTNNQLKIIACISMLFDHLGFMVFPKLIIFRILGRLAFPIFAFMIAEGCYYTRNKLKHFLTIFVIGVVMQIVLYFVMGMTDFSIFLVFSVSIILIYIFDLVEKLFKNKKHILGTLLSILLTGLIIHWYGLLINMITLKLTITSMELSLHL